MRKLIEFIVLLPTGVLMSGPFAIWGTIIGAVIGFILGALIF
jgi:hypothetical protein